MLKEERHHFILHLINLHNKVYSTTLSKELNVSEDTIRRDLKELAEGGYIKKVHGGALANPHITPAQINPTPNEELLEIAKKARDLIHNDEVIILDGSPANQILIDLLPRDLKAVIFTNSLTIATRLCEFPNLEVIFLGGKIIHKSLVSAGLEVINYLKDIHADLCLLQTSSIHPDIGITDSDRELSLTKKAFIDASRNVIGLCLSNAINRIQPFKIESITKIQTLVTELKPTHESLQSFTNKGVKVL